MLGGLSTGIIQSSVSLPTALAGQPRPSPRLPEPPGHTLCHLGFGPALTIHPHCPFLASPVISLKCRPPGNKPDVGPRVRIALGFRSVHRCSGSGLPWASSLPLSPPPKTLRAQPSTALWPILPHPCGWPGHCLLWIGHCHSLPCLPAQSFPHLQLPGRRLPRRDSPFPASVPAPCCP